MNTNEDPQPEAYELADFGDRAIARIIDMFLMGCLGLGVLAFMLPGIFLVDPAGKGGLDSLSTVGFVFLAMVLLASIPVVCYEAVYTSRRGYTTGKGPTLQVIRWEEYLNPTGDDKYPDMFSSFFRWAVLHCLFPLVAISVLFDKDRRGWHDMAAGTVVVKAPRPGVSLDDVDRWDGKASAAIVAFVSRLTGRSNTRPETRESRGDHD